MTIIDTDKIQQLLDSSVSGYEIEKRSGVSRANISLYRTKAAKILNMNLDKAIKLQKFWEEYTMKNNENPLLKENRKYDELYENKNVKFARLTFAGDKESTIFENENFGSRKKKPSWKKENGEFYKGIVDANPTSSLAESSKTEISKDGKTWQSVSFLAKNMDNSK